MTKIIPAILEQNIDAIGKKLALLHGVSKMVQIDICDGVFTESLTWPYVTAPAPDKALNYDKVFQKMIAQQAEMPLWEDFDFELDIMVSDIHRLLPDLMNIGPSRIVLHIESFTDFEDEIFDLKKSIPSIIEVGIAFNPDTSLEKIYPLVDKKLVTFVQCMDIAKIGVQGSAFDERVFAKTIENIKNLRTKYFDLDISVDGGVSLETARALVDAGATRLISGSVMFTGVSPEKRMMEFTAVLK